MHDTFGGAAKCVVIDIDIEMDVQRRADEMLTRFRPESERRRA
jgi:hypothetical protein